MNILEKLGKEIVFFDGGFGTLLQERGLKTGEIPEMYNIEKPEIIYQIHKDYVDSGAEIVNANTFGANKIKLKGYDTDKMITEGIKIAKKACGDKALVALDLGPVGKLLKPFGDLEFDKAYDAFKEMVICGEKAGADLINIETMTDIYEAKIAILASKENTNLPVIITFSFDENGKLLTGGDISVAVSVAENLGITAIGCNCGTGPDGMLEFVKEMRKYTSLPIIANPNAGLPVNINGRTHFNLDAEDFSDKMIEIVKAGACGIGGCCGTTPLHIKRTVDKCSKLSPLSIEKKNITIVSSYAKSVIIGQKPVIIGERINPTGKPRLKQALRDNDFNYILNEGFAQVDAGADILDVNVGLPEINEKDAMLKAVTDLQSVINVPLQIDTSDINALESALRIYNGKPLVNSVNGKQESMHSVFPLVKKYGASVVALTLDGNGIPETADERIKIAEKIIATANEYGIDKKDIIVDTLAMTVSSDIMNAKITLEALSYIRNTLGVNTILGVSNVSFGLPKREYINSAFLTMALQSGLSTAIINPLNELMMNALYSYNVLSGNDNACMQYIEKVSPQANIQSVQTKTDIDLKTAIIRGVKDEAVSITKEMLKTEKPLDIINQHIIPALDKVGIDFENKKLFLPNLLMSAETAKASFEEIKFLLSENGDCEKKKGKIILATVKGDVHDIGKNIVKVMLESYNYDVVDLGKDIDPQLIVDTAKRDNIKLVGLSALMTTTVVNMEETIKLLKENKVDCKVMVGGAVLTENYAKSIGADFYSPDAMGSVRYAEKLFC